MFLWPERSEVKAIRVPSGDQMGLILSAGSKVSRVLLPRSRSKTQMSRVLVCGSRMQTASLLSSGESEGLEESATWPMAASFLPVRSNHCREPWEDWVLLRHASTPLGEAEKVAIYCEVRDP